MNQPNKYYSYCHNGIKSFQDMLSPLKNMKMRVVQGNFSESSSKHMPYTCLHCCNSCFCKPFAILAATYRAEAKKAHDF